MTAFATRSLHIPPRAVPQLRGGSRRLVTIWGGHSASLDVPCMFFKCPLRSAGRAPTAGPQFGRFGRGDGDERLSRVSAVARIRQPSLRHSAPKEDEAATKYVFFRLPSGWVGAQHSTPNYRLVICLAGVLRFIGSTGEALTLRPGDRMMDTNTSGKGHATEVLSSEPVEGIIIRID
jgi:hypothetical protein